ncbi:MAG: SWIB/MDM2 domain-containing protein [Candidatus Kapaibacteriota bacterium]
MATKKATPVPPQPTTDSKAPKKQPVVAKLPATKTATATAASTAPAATVTPVSLTPVKTEDSVVPGDASGAEVATVKDNAVSVIIEKVNNLFASFKEVQNLLKVLSKDYEKQQKIIEKAQKKRQNAKNSPSGFAKPNKISDELCDFIGVPHGTEKSRTDITRFINSYVKEHNLNKPENKRFILPDDKLKKILNVGDKEDINYFILQKLISHHFPPSASKLAASV